MGNPLRSSELEVRSPWPETAQNPWDPKRCSRAVTNDASMLMIAFGLASVRNFFTLLPTGWTAAVVTTATATTNGNVVTAQ